MFVNLPLLMLKASGGGEEGGNRDSDQQAPAGNLRQVEVQVYRNICGISALLTLIQHCTYCKLYCTYIHVVRKRWTVLYGHSKS
jgi:hypothetical protein